MERIQYGLSINVTVRSELEKQLHTFIHDSFPNMTSIITTFDTKPKVFAMLLIQ